ncbi:MAG: hypothetical protein HY562_09190, partial [Ignavibacteriales bacterium]|nr:hypothetical protein [Ignavibacteriales bacterium]
HKPEGASGGGKKEREAEIHRSDSNQRPRGDNNNITRKWRKNVLNVGYPGNDDIDPQGIKLGEVVDKSLHDRSLVLL